MSEQTSTTSTPTNVVPQSGDSASMLAGVTSANAGNGAKRPTPKPAPAKRPAQTKRSTPKPASKPAGKGPRAAVKVGATKSSRPASKLADLLPAEYAGTLTDAKHEVARAAVDAFGKVAQSWNPKRHNGIPAEFVAFALASWVNYAPVPADYWSDSLAPRSGAGGRGAQNRQPATKTARGTKTAQTSKTAGTARGTSARSTTSKTAAKRAA